MKPSSGIPQAWDPHAVRVAVAQVQSLADGFVSDLSGESFRTELEKVLTEAIEPAAETGSEELGNRIALLLYGAAIVGAAGLGLSAELGRTTRSEVRAMVGQAIDAWLESPLVES
jgi:hypothetical protein